MDTVPLSPFSMGVAYPESARAPKQAFATQSGSVSFADNCGSIRLTSVTTKRQASAFALLPCRVRPNDFRKLTSSGIGGSSTSLSNSSNHPAEIAFTLEI
jgi:hypothetical protein